MSEENKIKLQNFDISLLFAIQPYDGEMFEYEMKIDSVESIWYPLELISKRKYKEVFPNDYNVTHAELIGLKIKANDESNINNLFFYLNTKPYGSITVNYSNLNDDNANKIAEIRKIIGR